MRGRPAAPIDAGLCAPRSSGKLLLSGTSAVQIPARHSSRQAARRIFRNAGALIGGKAFGGLLSLAYIAIAARSLGPSEMGYLVLAHAYATVVAGLSRFQSWQAVVRFGAPMVAEGNAAGFRALLRYAVRLDLVSAAASAALALIFVGPVAAWMDWPEPAMPLVYAYCATVPFLLAATPVGVLRLFDRFRTLGWQLALLPSVRFVGAVTLWILDGGLAGFLLVWIASALLDGVSLWVLAWRELRKRDLAPRLRPEAGAAPSPDWLPFMVKTTLSSAVDLARCNLPLLVVGGVLGSAASGFLQLAINLSNLIAHPATMLYQATFPELSRISASGALAQMRKVALRSTLTGAALAAPLVLAFAVLSEPLAVFVGGPEFAPAAPLIALMALAQLIRLASVILEAAVVSAGGAGFALAAQGLSALLALAALFALMPALGAAAAPASIIAGWALLAASCLVSLYIRRS